MVRRRCGSRLAGDGLLVLDVQMAAGSEAVGAPGRSWGVISGRGLVERPEDQSGLPDACAGQDLPAGGELTCSIAFRPTPDQRASQLVAVFGRDGQRASWSWRRERRDACSGCSGWRVRSVSPATGATIQEVVTTAEQFDLVVIGGGPGGYAAALYGASAPV